MKRLFNLEFHRLFKQKSAWVVFFIILLASALQVFLAYVSRIEDLVTGEFYYYFTARSIMESSFGLGSIQVLLIGIISSLFIAQDINQGTIRNKIIAGYSKFEIYTVQMVMSLILAISGLFLFHLIPTIFSGLITFPTFDNGTDTFENFLITMAFGYMLVSVGVLLTSFIALHAKNVATAIIFTLLIFVLGPALTSIVKAITETFVLLELDAFGDPLAYQEAVDFVEGIFEYVYFHQLNRLIGAFSFGNFGEVARLNFLNDDNFSYIWKTIVTNLVLITLLFGVGGYAFARSDLK